jgi:hypothetical protein
MKTNIEANALDPEKCRFALAAPHYHAILQHHISPLINGVHCTNFFTLKKEACVNVMAPFCVRKDKNA